MRINYKTIFREEFSKALLPLGYVYKGQSFIRYRPYTHMLQIIRLTMRYGGRDFHFEFGTVPTLVKIDEVNKLLDVDLIDSDVAQIRYCGRITLDNWNSPLENSTGMFDPPYDEAGFRSQLQKNLEHIILGEVGNSLLEICDYNDYTTKYEKFEVPSYKTVLCLFMANQRKEAIEIANELIPKWIKGVSKDKRFLQDNLAIKERSEVLERSRMELIKIIQIHERILYNLNLLTAEKDEELKARIASDEQESDEFLRRYLKM